MTQQKTTVTGVILAGGLARRMNHQDKGLIHYKGQPLISYAIAAVASEVDLLMINANRNRIQYQQFGYPVIADQTNSFDGPLAGILSALHVAKMGVLVVVPCDSPLIKAAHVQKLLQTRAENDADIAVAFDGERLHPVFLALNTTLKDSLQTYLESGQRKVEAWLQQHNFVIANFATEPTIFTNINTLTELSALENSADEPPII